LKEAIIATNASLQVDLLKSKAKSNGKKAKTQEGDQGNMAVVVLNAIIAAKQFTLARRLLLRNMFTT
jgi:hypothetical protein